jgi:hypothetical protein
MTNHDFTPECSQYLRTAASREDGRCAGLLLPSLNVHAPHDEPQLQWNFPEGGCGSDVERQIVGVPLC